MGVAINIPPDMHGSSIVIIMFWKNLFIFIFSFCFADPERHGVHIKLLFLAGDIRLCIFEEIKGYS